MDRETRKRLDEIIKSVSAIRKDVKSVKAEALKARDGMLKVFDHADYEAADAACSKLDYAVDCLEDAVFYLKAARIK